MTATTLPSQQALAETAAELALAAQKVEDKRNMNALNKAAYHLACGVRVVESAGALLIPSATTSGQIYRVSSRGCTCEAGLKGVACWHLAISEVVTAARERQERADILEFETPYDLAVREMDELFA